MLLRRSWLALSALALVLLTGCGPRWIVLRQASPNVLLGQTRFAVHPIDFRDLHVGAKDEADYLAEKSEDQRAAWQRDKVEVNAKFTEALMKGAAERGLSVVLATGPDSAPYFISAHVARMEPGFYAVVASGPGAVALELTISAADGRPLDRIMLDVPSNGVSVTMRLAGSAAGAGDQLARYLHERSAPGED